MASIAYEQKQVGCFFVSGRFLFGRPSGVGSGQLSGFRRRLISSFKAHPLQPEQGLPGGRGVVKSLETFHPMYAATPIPISIIAIS